MNQADLAATALAAGQPNRLLAALAGDDAAVRRYRNGSTPGSSRPSCAVSDRVALESGRPEMRQTLDRAEVP